jgi:LacI family transcriptional regulator
MTSKTSTLKHREIARALRQEIKTGLWQAGERLPGEQDLARRFEVSYMTMRQAVTNLVQESVLVRVRGKGTFVVSQNRQQEVGRTGQPIALLIPQELQRMDPYYFPEVLEGFQEAIDAAGRRASLYSFDAVEHSGVLEPGTAVACLLIERPGLQMVEKLRDSGYRVLAINRYSGRRSIPCVRIDDARGVEQAVGHLASLGHDRIGFVAGPRNNLDAADRARGFRTGVKRYGVRVAPEAGDAFTEASGYAAAREMLSGPHRPTALVCASDLSAIGAIKAARDYGLSVPRGLSVVGYGDFSVADYISPSLSTIKQSRRALGKAAAESLILLADGEETAGVVLDAELIVRESTAQNVSAFASAVH